MKRFAALACSIAACATFASVATAAENQPAKKSGFYVGGEAGWSGSQSTNWGDDQNNFNLQIFGSANGRANKLNSDAGNAAVMGLMAGYQFTDWFRADLGVDYRTGYQVNGSRTDITIKQYKSDVDVWTVMANGYVEPFTFGSFKPYVGVGLGTAIVSTSGGKVAYNNGSGDSKLAGLTQTNFAWDAKAGVGYALTDKWSLDLGYRHLDAGKVSVGSGGNNGKTKGDGLETNEVLLGVRFGL